MLTVAERAQRAANRKKHLQIKKTLLSIWQRTCCKRSQHNQKRNALQIKCIWLCCEHLQCVSLFVCVVSICTIWCQNDENIFLICWCFFYLHVFSEVAARWALSATVDAFIQSDLQMRNTSDLSQRSNLMCPCWKTKKIVLISNLWTVVYK